MTEHVHHTMDRNIFNLKLSVEATSAYILITSLMGENVRPSMELIQGRWTTTDEELEQALTELINRNIVSKREGLNQEELYYPNPSSLWR